MTSEARNNLDQFVRHGRGKCTGCDKVRVLYRYEWSAGRREFSDGATFHERYCRECLSHVANSILDRK